MSPSNYPSITRMFGIELEFFLVNKEGVVTNDADRIIKGTKNKLRESNVTKECGHGMIELTTFPHRSSRDVFTDFFKDFETFLYECELNDLGVNFNGTYPGKNENRMREDERYSLKGKILGEENWKRANKCIGFHYHYSLPRNAFNKNIKFFYPDLPTVKKEKVLNLYNLYVALDPAITSFMQSSPYYEGKLLGKDSRMMVYRGDSIFNIQNQLYSEYQRFGVLNKYRKDFSDLHSNIVRKASEWKELLSDKGQKLRDFAKKDAQLSILDSSWNPVKISPHGTIESRGSDMNSLSRIVALTSMLNTLSKYVQNNKVTVVPGRRGIDEPFSIEDRKLYVPDFEYLRHILQRNSAIDGFEDPLVLKYSKSLLDLIREITPIEAHAPLRVFRKMVSEEETASDKIIKRVKKMQGYTNYDIVEEETAREMSIIDSEKIYRDLILTKKMVEENLMFV